MLKVVLLGCCFLFCWWAIFAVATGFSNRLDEYASSSIAHAFFGFGLAIFWSMLFKSDRKILFASFICMAVWEIFEEIFFPIKPSTIPLDTLADLLFGFGFAWIYVKSLNIKLNKY